MPQSTLMEWLSKPVDSKTSSPTKDNTGQGRSDDTHSLELPRDTSAEVTTGAENKLVREMIEDNESISNGLSSLPPNVEIRACAKDDIKSLKRLTGLLLPIQYPEAFYREIIEDQITNNITLVAIWHNSPAPNTSSKEPGVLIGAIRCRLLAYPPMDPAQTTIKEGPMLYLSTLVLLSPYRSHGIATHMLNMLTKRAVRDYGVTSVGAHVWEANLDGLEWYRKRGFLEVAREDGYYRRLKPSTAVVMQRKVGVLDLVGG